MITNETRLTRFVALLLLAAGVYGVYAGAHVTLYYNLVPNMPAREDSLGTPVGLAYLAAIVLSLAHLPLAAWDLKHRRGRAAAMRVFAFVGPVIVAVGAEGVISHALWWSALSDTDRYHLLHHALVAGWPLAAGYALALRWAWQPAALTAPAHVSLRAVAASVSGGCMVILPLGILMGFPSPPVIAILEISGAVALLALWLTRRRATPARA
jgi:hypothetical protein